MFDRNKLTALAGRLRAVRVEPIEVLFALCLWLALSSLFTLAFDPLGHYDEGILLTNAQMIADGRVPYRDFYANYPPGIFQLVRALLTLSDRPIWCLRLLTLAVRILTALLAARLATHGRGRLIGFATFSSVLVLQSDLGLVGYAYTYAVLLSLAILASWPPPASPAWRSLGSGALLGCLSYLRHDLFVYLTLQLVALEALTWILRKRSLFFGSARQLAMVLSSTVGVALALWLPLLVEAGVMRPLHDLLLDQALLVMPARKLPIPPLFESVFSAALDLNLPALLAERLRLGLVLTAFSVAVACWASFRSLSAPEPSQEGRITVLATAFALSTLPQVFGRTDYWHVAPGLPLLLVASLSPLGRRAAQAVALLSLVPWLSDGVQLIGAEELSRFWRADDSAFLSDDGRKVRDFLRAHTKEREPIFVGCRKHRRTMVSTVDVYYWAHRPGATRYMQFDPGLVNTPTGQELMVADLERTKPRYALRYPNCAWDEDNASKIKGPKRLDDYLSSTYTPLTVIGDFAVWQRNSAP